MRVAVVLAVVLAGSRGSAAEQFVGFNETTSTVFAGVYLAPAGSTWWGPNQALNDKDRSWDYGERLKITGLSRGVFDLKLIDRSGRACVKHSIDLTKERTFEVRDEDLRGCVAGHPG
jgi:hypothetical protein